MNFWRVMVGHHKRTPLCTYDCPPLNRPNQYGLIHNRSSFYWSVLTLLELNVPKSWSYLELGNKLLFLSIRHICHILLKRFFKNEHKTGPQTEKKWTTFAQTKRVILSNHRVRQIDLSSIRKVANKKPVLQLLCGDNWFIFIQSPDRKSHDIFASLWWTHFKKAFIKYSRLLTVRFHSGFVVVGRCVCVPFWLNIASRLKMTSPPLIFLLSKNTPDRDFPQRARSVGLMY